MYCKGYVRAGTEGERLIAFFDNMEQEMGKFNSHRKHTTCSVLSSTGLGKFCLLWRMHLVLTLVLVFFSLLLGFIIPGVKVNNKKLA